MSALITLNRLKDEIDVDYAVTTKDTVLTELIAEASNKIEQFCNQNILSADTTNLILSGNGKKEWTFPKFPVSALSSFQYRADGTVGNANWLDVDSTTYEAELYGPRYYIYMPDGFLLGTRNYRVTFTSGYVLASMPPLVTEVCAKLAAIEWFKMYQEGADRRIGLKSRAESLSGGGTGSTSFMNEGDAWWQDALEDGGFRVKPV